MRASRRAHDPGFTLVELIVVVAIMGVLVAVAIASFYVATGRSKRIACLQNQRVLQSSIVIYQSQYDGNMPANVDALRPFVNWPSVNYGRCTQGTDDDPKAFFMQGGIVKCPDPGHVP